VRVHQEDENRFPVYGEGDSALLRDEGQVSCPKCIADATQTKRALDTNQIYSDTLSLV
jgi:hypothetical protein